MDTLFAATAPIAPLPLAAAAPTAPAAPAGLPSNAKSFRAATMTAALARVQTELGAEALVLGTRRVMPSPAWQVWREPEFEVLAVPGPSQPAPVAPAAPERSKGWSEPVAKCHDRLATQGNDPAITAALASGAMEMLGPRALNDPRMVMSFIRLELKKRLNVGEYLPRKGEQRVIVMVGSSGSGKTSAAVKLAAYAHYTLGRSAGLISLDTFRVGALNQAQTYAEILGLPLRVAYTPAELDTAVTAFGDTEVVVIDTPGRNPYRPAEMLELATLLSPLPSARRLFLVASATRKLADLVDTVSAFRGLGLNALVMSHLDETQTFGSVYSLAALTGLPAAYFCTGPRVPQDIEPASPEALIERMLA